MRNEQLRAWKELLLERLTRYVAIDSSAIFGEPSPSSPGQVVLGRLLVDEMRAIGLVDVEQDRFSIVTATLPASPGLEAAPTIGYLGHLDTSPEAPATDVKPRVIHAYDGSRIDYPAVPGLSIDPDSLDELRGCIGHDIVVTDGTTLLGADDKSAIAAILTAMEHLVRHPEIRHGRIRVGILPDEEIGQGNRHVDIEKFGAVAAYTLDDDWIGTLCTETFSADRATIRIRGANSHPGTAKGRMINALKIAAEIVAAMPRDAAPETTDGRDGFLHPYDLTGSVAEAEIHLLIRDFDTAMLAERKHLLQSLMDDALARYPGATGSIEIARQYRNMADTLRDHPEVVARAEQAIRRVGLQPRRDPIRGGTDGAQLTERGLPCPNLFCGWHNAHAVTEWACLDEMALSVEVLIELAQIWATA